MRASTLVKDCVARRQPSPWPVRRASLADLDRLVPLATALAPCLGQAPAAHGQVRTWLQRLLLDWGSRLIVAGQGRHLTGFCAYNTHEQRLLALFVMDGYRGRNVGCELVAFAEQELARTGAARLQVRVDPENQEARAFFAHLGFDAGNGPDLYKAI
jgi:GNAT superfamily N-acetyltransferase